MRSLEIGELAVSFSYIVPVHNEAADIEAAIRSAEASARPDAPCEIVAVDDASTDDTRQILRQCCAEGRIRLVEQTERRGPAAARNAGIDVATGEVLVFMDADNLVPSDFLERLREHYLGGADFVTVESRAVNLERLIGRFQQASHVLNYDRLRNVTYSQSFSCRRELASAVRFREELAGGEDSDFFSRLPICGSWARDPDIVVGHRIPDTIAGFCRQYIWRGTCTFVGRRVNRSRSLWSLTLQQVGLLIYWLTVLVWIVPAVVAGYVRAIHSRRGLRDLPGFVGLCALEIAVRRVGEMQGLIRLWKQRTLAG